MRFLLILGLSSVSLYCNYWEKHLVSALRFPVCVCVCVCERESIYVYEEYN